MNQVLLGFGNEWICSLIKFGIFFSQGMMGNHKGKFRSSRSPMEKREKEPRAILVRQNGWRSKKTIMREGVRYKYLPGPNGQISHGIAAVPRCGTITL